MRQALRQVRDAQGPDAVILSSRRVPDGVEVVAFNDWLKTRSCGRSPTECATARLKTLAEGDKPAETRRASGLKAPRVGWQGR